MMFSQIRESEPGSLSESGYVLLESYKYKLPAQPKFGLPLEKMYFGSLYERKSAKYKKFAILGKGVLSGTMAALRYGHAVTLESAFELDFQYILAITSPHFVSTILGHLTQEDNAEILSHAIDRARLYKHQLNAHFPIHLIAISNATLMFYALAICVSRGAEWNITESNLRFSRSLRALNNVILCCPPRSIGTFAVNTIDKMLSYFSFWKEWYMMRTLLSLVSPRSLAIQIDAMLKGEEMLSILGIGLRNRPIVDYAEINFERSLKAFVIYEHNDCGVQLIECLEDALGLGDNLISFCISRGRSGTISGHGQIYSRGGNMLCVQNLLLGDEAQTNNFITLSRDEVPLLIAILGAQMNPNSTYETPFDDLKRYCGGIRSNNMGLNDHDSYNPAVCSGLHEAASYRQCTRYVGHDSLRNNSA